jgi:hypothetical protein
MHRANNQNHQELRVEAVAGRQAMRSFIEVPWHLYKNDPNWVAPLIMERQWHLSDKNPYFKHAEFQTWIAYRGKQPVGRISAQVDRLHLNQYNDQTGFFGCLEAEDKQETFQGLFSVCEEWLRQKGMRRIRGPFSLSINDECGLLVEGFDRPPPIMLGHARPYYGLQIEELGYVKAQDLLAYRICPRDFPADNVARLTKRVARKVRVRMMRRACFAEDLEIIRDIFNDAWSQNWGFVPFTSAEFKELGKNLKLLVDLECIRIAEIENKPVAMIVMFPNVNEIIKDLNGRLLPVGWLKFLWRLKVAGPKSARIPLMGVRRCYQGSSLGAALALMVIAPIREVALRRGIEEVDMSWILEQNQGARNIIESIGSTLYKRYRIYQKDIELL